MQPNHDGIPSLPAIFMQPEIADAPILRNEAMLTGQEAHRI